MTDPASGPPPQPADKDIKSLPSAAAFLGMGMSAAVIVGLCIVLGLWGDATWHTSPALLLVGLALGVVLAAVMVVQQIREYL